ncbi:MAG TPA: SpoIIE family protein phosphatase [Bacillota bacterium]|nr:SpoIIE family protein phosphatase [Peptococcaceae bacterium MAG4]HPZ42565.1 SpoIIE family protein phosphatase [Bacillota bacterium]HQD76488.1 SpoIIE family protein phosphatase [Bacillota bacterium]HUM58973.1 SpoIIE family protein phosphatase [Bacillota bacterium]
MTEEIVNTLIALIKSMCVVMVVAYLMTRSRFYQEILDKKITRYNLIGLIITCGLFSIYGTLGGISIAGAYANIRDLGPAIAGLVGGPVAGFGAALIGATHRYTLGGITALPCAVSTIIAGLAGGAIYKLKKGEFIGVRGAVLFTFSLEVLHMGLTLLLGRPYDQAVIVVKQVALPMIFTNTLGMAVFAFIIVNLIKEKTTEAEKELIEGELKVAREIQMSIVPKMFPPFPDRSEFDIYAILEPAKEVGGDFYDFFFLDDDHLCLTIGDVSGKGVPASLFMAVTKTLIKAEASRAFEPDLILSTVNDKLCSDNDSGMFVTVFLGVLNVHSGFFDYCNGGHNSPYLVRSGGHIEPLPKTEGIALGVMEGIPYSRKTIKLAAGDTLLLYTDGVTEAADKEHRLFGEGLLEEVLRQAGSYGPKKLTLQLLDEIRRFAKGAEQSDDITILTLKYFLESREMSMQLKNDLSEIESINRHIEEFGETNQLPPDVIFNLNLSLEEIFVNIVSYGYEDENEHFVKISMSLVDNELVVKVEDDGREFNPLELPEPDLEQKLEERPIGGLGIHLVRNLMDELDYKRTHNKNILTMKKKINQRG